MIALEENTMLILSFWTESEDPVYTVYSSVCIFWMQYSMAKPHYSNEPPHDKTNKMMCAQRRLRSAWASAQSDHSLHCSHEETLGPQLPIERTAKTLIRLCGCPGWSESSLGTHVILLVLSWGSSNVRMITAIFFGRLKFSDFYGIGTPENVL